MTKVRAEISIIVVAMVIISIAMPGLLALGANGATIALMVVVVAGTASCLLARVVMLYGSKAEERERLQR